MKNERKTESLVRKYLKDKGYYEDPNIVIEEQSSENPKINKLLKNASKKGDKQGHPEFIITSKIYPDFIIVIECKADITKHESDKHDQYADYAVDGVLLYASFLSREFDVLAIGVSGQDLEEVKISHYLFVKNGNKEVQIFGKERLGFEDYLDGCMHSPEKFRQDYNSLLAFSRELNQELHSNKILESQRGLLISSILIALDNKVRWSPKTGQVVKIESCS